jgi:DnaJ-class molecular chaperone
MRELSKRQCSTCKGAGAFWKRSAKQWSQNEDEPEDQTPVAIICYACNGSGEARDNYVRPVERELGCDNGNAP